MQPAAANTANSVHRIAIAGTLVTERPLGNVLGGSDATGGLAVGGIHVNTTGHGTQ